MERPHIPPELVESILSNLYFDTATLLNCALVAQAWVPSSQRGIFRELILKLPSKNLEDFATRLDAFLDASKRRVALLDDKPYLASYVRTLQLQELVEFEGDSEHALYSATTSVMERLSNVETLKVWSADWAVLSHVLREELTRILRSPSLTQVILGGMFIPTAAQLASLISCARHLKGLNVFAVRYLDTNSSTEFTAGTSLPPKSTTQLEQLKLDHTILPFIDWFHHDSCPFQVQNLQSLYLGPGLFLYSDVIALLQYVGRNLRQLELMCLQAQGQSELSFCFLFAYVLLELNKHLEYTPNLQALYLYGLRQGVSFTPVPIIQALLNSLLNNINQDGSRRVATLQHLTVDLLLITGAHDWNHWSVIDALLEKPEFALLETVVFKLFGNYNLPNFRGSFLDDKELLAKELAVLGRSGRLTVQIGS